MADRTKFVKLYTDLPDHPVWMDLDPEHVGLWVLALMYCRRNLTDGHFPAKGVRRWGGQQSTVDELVAAGRLHGPGHGCEDCPEVAEGDLYVHDFLAHQMSKADAERLSSKRAEAGRRGGRRKAADQGQQQAAKQVAKQPGGKSEADPDTDPDTDTPTRKRDTAAADAAAESFDRFWTRYPRKSGKGAARKAWAKALRTTDADTILAGLGAAVAGWQACGTEQRFIPHPTTWLNQERWTDEQTLPEPSQQSAADRQAALYDMPPLPEPPEDVANDPTAYRAWAKRIRAEQRAQLT